MKKHLYLIILTIIPVSISAQFSCGDTMTDIRDGKKYPTIQIGSQCWLGANLDVGLMVMALNNANVQTDNGIIEKFCYDNDSSNCNTYGGLYQWDEMMSYTSGTQNIQGICPDGWHLPEVSEWITLFSQFDPGTVGYDLQIGGSSGFEAPPAGYCYHNYSNWVFGSIGSYGVYRTTANQTSLGNTYSTVFYYYPFQGSISTGNAYKKANGYSIRCLWDGPTTGLIDREPADLQIGQPYPNPTSGNFKLTILLDGESKNVYLIMRDEQGRIVYKNNVDPGRREVFIDEHGLSPGVYFVYLESNGERSQVRMVELL